ncbi:unnamed protein product [Calypogeia fissa]
MNALRAPGVESPLGVGTGGFKSLKLLSVKAADPLPVGPIGVQYGVLSNGLHYYVRRNSKPRLRAALALGVRVGSVLELEEERGVAHIVEHLAFSATRRYTNHDIVRFLESVGAEFGACQNASTSHDETIYELVVPIDKPELLSQALSILAEFSTEVRVSEEDLEKERGAVLEELRGSRNALGRMQEAHWVLMMKGSQYADRQPIGLEKVIRNCSATAVKEFYQKWYRPEHMAIVAVGDFPDVGDVVELIKTHFEEKQGVRIESPLTIPLYPVPSHEEPRFSCFAEAEAGGSAVMLSCKLPSTDIVTIADYRFSLAEGIFHNALNQRFFKISRKQDPPFFSCSTSSEAFVRPVKAYIMSANCKERGTLQALESMLTEVARVRLHGFSDREIALVRAFLMADIESAYLEKDQVPSTSLRDEYLQHFLRGEPVFGIEYEAQLQKTLLPEITAAEVAKIADFYLSKNSCVVKTVEPRARVTSDALKGVLRKVEALESSGDLSQWDEELIPDDIVDKKPNPGSIKSTTEFPEFGATELILSNGMRVCYKCTDFLDDQVLINGYTYGGLSEVLESEFLSCSMGSTIAGEIGVFGHRPPMLLDMLAGKRAEVGTKVGAYMRTFSGDCSPADLETALQLLYQLFITSVQPGDEEVRLVMQMTREAIKAQERDPFTAYANRVRELNYGNSYYFKPFTAKDLNKVDPKKACQYFDNCFKDPSSFTVAIVGNIEPDKAIPLILQYLGGIPKPEMPIMQYQRDELRALPFTFPDGIVREEVRRHMVEAQCSVQITFPVEFKGPQVMTEVHYTGFICKLLDTKIMQVLRFKHGQVYSVAVSAFLGGSKPSRSGNVRGNVAINFSCDPESSWNLVDLALEEVTRLQVEGPSEEDVATVLELEQRTYENGQQENGYWLDRLLRAYQSRVYTGDLKASFQSQEEWRNTVRSVLTPATMKDAMCRILPVPCREHHTAVTLMPKPHRLTKLMDAIITSDKSLRTESKVVLATAGVILFGAILWRYSQRS